MSRLLKGMIYWDNSAYFIIKYCILHWYFDYILSVGVAFQFTIWYYEKMTEMWLPESYILALLCMNILILFFK